MQSNGVVQGNGFVYMVVLAVLSKEVDMPNVVTYLIGQLYLSGMRLGVAPRTKTKKTCFRKRLDWMLKPSITNLDSIINIILTYYGGRGGSI